MACAFGIFGASWFFYKQWHNIKKTTNVKATSSSVSKKNNSQGG